MQLVKEVRWVVCSRERMNSILNTPLYANSIYLILNAVAHSGFGFIFWVIVARSYSAEAVGLSSALLSIATLLSFIANLGLGMSLIRFLPSSGSEAPKLINSSFTLSGLAAIILGAIFLAGLPIWSPALGFVLGNYIFIAAFIILVVVSTFLERLAEVFIALRRTSFVLLQYAIANVFRFLLVIILASYFRVFGIIVAPLLGITFALGISILFFLPRIMPGYRPIPNLTSMLTREISRFSLANYISVALWNAPTWLLPLIVINLLGSQSNAYFYISWSIATFLFIIPHSVSYALFAEGSQMDSHLKNHVRRSLKFLIILVPAVIIIMLVGDKILLLFGSEYSLAGRWLLRIAAPTALPLAINTTYLGIIRVRKRLREIALLSAGIAVSTLILSYLLIPHMGIIGPGVAWLASNTTAAFIVLPGVVKLLRADTPGEPGSMVVNSDG